MASILAVTKVNKQLNTVSDIIDKDLELYVLGGTASLDTFIFAEEESVERLIYDTQVSKDPKFTMRPASKLLSNFVENPKGVILLNPLQFDYWVDENREVGCLMERMPRTVPINFAFPLQKGSPFKQLFDYQLIKLDEFGVIGKLKTKYIQSLAKSESYMCSSLETGDGLSKVEFGRVIEIFVLLGFGVLAAIIILGVEKVVIPNICSSGDQNEDIIS